MLLSNDILDGMFSVAALTPIEKWQSAGKLDEGGGMLIDGYMAVLLIVLIVLIVLLAVVNNISKSKKSANSEDVFIENGKRKGLNKNEIHIMRLISHGMPHVDPDLFFVMPDAFNNGVKRIMNKLAANDLAEQAKKFENEVGLLSKKLGFIKKAPSNAVEIDKDDLSSRQIPVESKVHIVPRMSTEGMDDIECFVSDNSGVGITVTVAQGVVLPKCEYWSVRYCFGSSVWEFDTKVVSSADNSVTFGHSDDIRFINRRRFSRVGVKMPALVAHFDFSYKRIMGLNTKGPIHDQINEQAIKDYSGEIWGSPDFYPAAITEIGGPGLRVTVPFYIEKDQRVLVVFRSCLEKNDELGEEQFETEIIQDVAEVRSVQEVEHGYSLAVEFTSTNERNISKMIQLTNKAAAGKTAKEKQGAQTGKQTEEAASELGVVL